MDGQPDDVGLQIRAFGELVDGECGMELVPVVVGADPAVFKLPEQRFRLVDDEREASGHAPFGSAGKEAAPPRDR